MSVGKGFWQTAIGYSGSVIVSAQQGVKAGLVEPDDELVVHLDHRDALLPVLPAPYT